MADRALAKQERLEHANQLIKIIGSHGRRFFWNEGKQRFASLALMRGRVYYVDDYSGELVYTHHTPFGNDWRGFSHGGTLKALVQDMRDYVMHGTRIPRWRIVIERLQGGLANNIWGYPLEAALAVRAAAYALPICAEADTEDLDLLDEPAATSTQGEA